MVSKPARNVADGIQDLTWSEMEGFVNNIMNAVAANDTNPRRRIAEALLTWAEATQAEAEIEDAEADTAKTDGQRDDEALRGEPDPVF